MRFLQGIEKFCLRTAAAGSVSWVLAHVGTDNQFSSACLQSSTTFGTRVRLMGGNLYKIQCSF